MSHVCGASSRRKSLQKQEELVFPRKYYSTRCSLESFSSSLKGVSYFLKILKGTQFSLLSLDFPPFHFKAKNPLPHPSLEAPNVYSRCKIMAVRFQCNYEESSLSCVHFIPNNLEIQNIRRMMWKELTCTISDLITKS